MPFNIELLYIHKMEYYIAIKKDEVLCRYGKSMIYKVEKTRFRITNRVCYHLC